MEITGFCETCTAANVAERYEERETREAEARNRGWREWDRIRQRHHRLMVKLRPAELASPQTDPLELGKYALQLLGQIRFQGAYQMPMREQIGELVRQLAGARRGEGPRDALSLRRGLQVRKVPSGQSRYVKGPGAGTVRTPAVW